MRRRLALGPGAARGDPLGQLSARQRTLVGQSGFDDGDGALGGVGRHALLAQPARVAGHARRGRQGEQPRIVLGRHEVQRAATEPAHGQRALVGEGGVDVGGAQSLGAGAQGQARRTQVLGLHREQPSDDGIGLRSAGAVQELRRRPTHAEAHVAFRRRQGGAIVRRPAATMRA